MPKALERKLWARVRKKRWSAKRKRAYVYGTMRKTGWVPSHQRKTSGSWARHTRRTHAHGYKKCIINTLLRTKFTTPKQAHTAMSRAAAKCRKKLRE